MHVIPDRNAMPHKVPRILPSSSYLRTELPFPLACCARKVAQAGRKAISNTIDKTNEEKTDRR